MYSCLKRATVSAGLQARPVGGWTVLELKGYSTAIRAVSPTASDAAAQPLIYHSDIACEALEVSKFAVATLWAAPKTEPYARFLCDAPLNLLKFRGR